MHVEYLFYTIILLVVLLISIIFIWATYDDPIDGDVQIVMPLKDIKVIYHSVVNFPDEVFYVQFWKGWVCIRKIEHDCNSETCKYKTIAEIRCHVHECILYFIWAVTATYMQNFKRKSAHKAEVIKNLIVIVNEYSEYHRNEAEKCIEQINKIIHNSEN